MSLPAELQPKPHVFVEDSLSLEGDCAVCGLNIPHATTEPGEFDTDDDFGKALRCPNCPHFQHQAACDVVVSRWPTRVCPCGGERRDAVA